MPRPAKSVDIATRTARKKLTARREPYWATIHPGLSLGYYRPENDGPGSWWSRRRLASKYRIESMEASADDLASADGAAILSYPQAVQRLLKPHVAKTARTVADAAEAYIAELEADDRADSAVRHTRYHYAAFIQPTLGTTKLSALTPKLIKDWADGLAKSPPRVRTKPGEQQKYKAIPRGPEALRRRRASANRIITTLKAALNKAYREGAVDSDKAWRSLKPFRGVDRARIRYLTHDEVTRLSAAVDDPAFAALIEAALHTGARYGALCAATVSDFDGHAGTLRLRTRKGDGSVKVHYVHLTDAGITFFAKLCDGRNDPDAPILLRPDGGAWATSEQIWRMREASERASIKPAVSFHILRHTFASWCIMNGTPLIVVARNLGHADTRMVDRYYGHLAPSYQAEAIRKGAPNFVFATAP